MRFEEKLRKQMLLKGLNQQKLARLSSVSDSEISRILGGKSTNPGLENALKLAKSLGVSLDYLADDSLDEDPPRVVESSTVLVEPNGVEAEILEAARELGGRQARRILETVCEMGYETAICRLLEMRPVKEVGDASRAATANSVKPGRQISPA